MEEFVEKINRYLIENDHRQALDTVRDAGTDEILNKTSWELVPIIVKFLTQQNFDNNVELFESCTDILHIIADKCNPAETVLLLLEQAESSENDVRFRSLLQPLSLCLKRSDPSRYIEWIVSTIRAYTEALPLPENKMLRSSTENESIEDTDPLVERLNTTYQSISTFLKSLVDNEIFRNDSKKTGVKLYLIQLHLILFGKPFSHLNINTETEDESNAFLSSIMQIAQMKGNLLAFLSIIIDRSNKRMVKFTTTDVNIDDINHLEIRLLRSEVPDLAYANYYFILMSSKLLQHHIPHVYNPSYVMTSCFYLGNYLLTQSEYILVSKGLRLINNTLLRIEIETIEHEALELSVYTNLLSSLSQVMIYCDSINERKMALNTFRNYIERFNVRARYLVIIYLYETSNHSGFLALVINILKESIVKALDEKPPCQYFIGKNLETLLKRVYKLPHGSSSDLVEISDEVIAALNLLRFLIIRDKADVTGIWSLVDDIQNNYLRLLREGIDLARAHWKVKIKDLENQKKECGGIMKSEIMNDDIIVTVGGENLPRMPIEEKIKFCHQALNALDIIESIRSLWNSRQLLSTEAHHNEEGVNGDSKINAEEEYEKNIKNKILAASMPYVNEHGWSKQAISAGAEAIGYPGVIHGMFRNGGAELVQHFYASCNAKLVNLLKAEASAIEADLTKNKKSSEIIVRNALETRLRMLIPYKSTWPQAIAIMTLPPNVPNALANLLTMADDICYYAGDRSVDFNWYTRRVVLASIYKTTELYLLQDTSEDHKKTWEFMDRRIEDALQLHGLIKITSGLPPPDQAINRAADAASAAFITARNILGLNWNR